MEYEYLIVKSENGHPSIKFPDANPVLEYLFEDMESFNAPIFLSFIERVLSGESSYEEVSGNICSLEIGKDTTKIISEFSPDGNILECIIKTDELLELIKIWVDMCRK